MDDHRIHTIVPRLRFPDFANEGEWDYVNGNELFEPIVNKNHNSDLPVLAITQDQGAVPRDMIDYNIVVSDKSIAGYKVVEVGDFIISLRSFQGGIEYSNYKGLCSPAYIVLRRKNERVCNEFYRYYFKSPRFIQDLNRNLEGIRDGKMVSYQQFSAIMIPFPSLAEQRCIAACLSVLDEMLAATNARLGQLKAYKKSLMQKLFPAKGKKLPELRFKEFEKDGEWEEKELGVAAKVKSGYAFRSNTYTQTGRYKIITISNVKNGYLDLTSNNFVEHLPEDIQPHQILKKGDILISMTGNVGRVCKVCCDNCLLNQRVGLVDVYSSDVDRNYIYTILTSDWFEKSMIESGQGAAQANIGNKDIEGYRFFCPPTLLEQRKIADSVTSIDEMINQYVNKVTLLELYKNGLMQQMFPNAK